MNEFVPGIGLSCLRKFVNENSNMFLLERLFV